MIQSNRTITKIDIKPSKLKNPLASQQIKGSSQGSRYLKSINQNCKLKCIRRKSSQNTNFLKESFKSKHVDPLPVEKPLALQESELLNKSLPVEAQFKDPLPSINPSSTNRYNTYRFLGSGAFGSVYSAYGKNGRVAIKKVKIDKQYINREVEILKMLDSPYCLKLLDSYTVTEQINNNNLCHSASSIPTLIKLNTDFNSNLENNRTFINEKSDLNKKSIQQMHVPTVPSFKDTKSVTELMNTEREITYQFIVTEQMPYSLKQYLDQLYSMKIKIDPLLMKLFIYNMFAGLSYLHSLHITHRDIKTCNLLVNDHTGELKICDFGSAKIINGSYLNGSDFDVSVSYIASRMFRAPELLLDCCKYGSAIDIWAAGCVIGEMLNESMPMFMGSSNSDQLVQIMKILGPPTNEDIDSFEHSLEFPEVEQISNLKNVLPINIDKDLFELLSKILVYNPAKRPTANECMMSPYFDELFEEGKTLSNGRPLPILHPRQL